MFLVNDDLSIYVNRGDALALRISATQNGLPYQFQAGDILRMSIFKKKACNEVVRQKEFPILASCSQAEISLSGADTRIGGIISKPVDYWYEIELNPMNNPQTIIGYDENGPKIFKLLPEGREISGGEVLPEDIPIVDAQLDPTSKRPIQNQAVARKFLEIEQRIKDKSSVVFGGTVPNKGPVLWIDTGEGRQNVLGLSQYRNQPVQATVDGMTYGIDNGTVNAGANPGKYDFTVQ